MPNVNEIKATFDETLSNSIGMLWDVMFDVAAKRSGPHWKLHKQEVQQLTNATNQLLSSIPAKMKSRVMDRLTVAMPLATFAMTIGMVTWPRIAISQAAVSQFPAQMQRRNAEGKMNASTINEGRKNGTNEVDHFGPNVTHESLEDYSGSSGLFFDSENA